MRFLITRTADERLVPQLVDDADEVILVGPATGSQDESVEALQDVIDDLEDRDRYTFLEEGGEHFYALVSESGAELGRSPAFASRQLAEDAADQVAEQAAEQRDYTVSFPAVTTAGEPIVERTRVAARAPASTLYDFSRASSSGHAGFEPFRGDDGKHSFHFNGEDGGALLYSRSFKSASARDRRMRAVALAAAAATSYERREEDGEHYFILKARNGREIARSGRFENAGDMESAIGRLRSSAPEHAKTLGAARRRRKAAGNQYDLGRASLAGAAGFETFRGDDGKYYFHFNDADGNAVLYSQAYSSAKARDAGVRAVIKSAGDESRYRQLEEDGQPYFVLRAGNWQEIGRSRAFESVAQMTAAMALVRATAPAYAETWGVRLGPDVTTAGDVLTLTAARAAAAPPAPVAGPPGEEAVGPGSGAGETPPAAPPERGRPWWPWALLLLLLLLVLVLLALRSCRESASDNTSIVPDTADLSSRETAPEPETPLPATDPTTVEETSAPPPSAPPALDTDEGPADLPPPTLPDADEQAGAPPATPRAPEDTTESSADPDSAVLGFATGTAVARMADLLAGPSPSLPATFTMDRVRFGFESARLNPEAHAEIDDLARLLRAYPGLRLAIRGHRDGTESSAYTGPAADGRITLSDVRARCIYRKLIDRGIAEDRLTFEGLGAAEPVAGDDTESGRQRNRRVEIVLVDR